LVARTAARRRARRLARASRRPHLLAARPAARAVLARAARPERRAPSVFAVLAALVARAAAGQGPAARVVRVPALVVALRRLVQPELPRPLAPAGRQPARRPAGGHHDHGPGLRPAEAR